MSDDLTDEQLADYAIAVVDNEPICPSGWGMRRLIADLFRQVRERERERCARLAETRPLACDEEWTLQQLAARIREGT